MAIYRCELCDAYIDDDWNPGEEYEGGLICQDCQVEQEEERENN